MASSSQKRPPSRIAPPMSAGEYLLNRQSLSNRVRSKQTKKRRRRLETDSEDEEIDVDLLDRNEDRQNRVLSPAQGASRQPLARHSTIPGQENLSPRDDGPQVVELSEGTIDNPETPVELLNIVTNQIRVNIAQLRHFCESDFDDFDSCKFQKLALKTLYRIFKLKHKRVDLKVFTPLMFGSFSRGTQSDIVVITDLLQLLQKIIKRPIKLPEGEDEDGVWWKRKKWALKVLLEIIKEYRTLTHIQDDLIEDLRMGDTLTHLLTLHRAPRDNYCPLRIISLALNCLSFIPNDLRSHTRFLESLAFPLICDYLNLEDEFYWDDEDPRRFLKINSPLNWFPEHEDEAEREYIMSKMNKISVRSSIQFLNNPFRNVGPYKLYNDLLLRYIQSRDMREKIVGLIMATPPTTMSSVGVVLNQGKIRELALEAMEQEEAPLYKAHLLIWLDVSLCLGRHEYSEEDLKRVLRLCLKCLADSEESIAVLTCAARCLRSWLNYSAQAVSGLLESESFHKPSVLRNLCKIYSKTNYVPGFCLISKLNLLRRESSQSQAFKEIQELSSDLLDSLSKVVIRSRPLELEDLRSELISNMVKLVNTYKCGHLSNETCQNIIQISSALRSRSTQELREQDIFDCCVLMARVFIGRSDERHVKQELESLVTHIATLNYLVDSHELMWNSYAQIGRLQRSETVYGSSEKLMRLYEHCRQKIVSQQYSQSIYTSHLVRYVLEMWPEQLLEQEEFKLVLRLFFETTIHGLRRMDDLSAVERFPTLQHCHLLMAFINALYLDYKLLCDVINDEFEPRSAGKHVKFYLGQWMKLCLDCEPPIGDFYASARLLSLIVSRDSHISDFDCLIENKPQLMSLVRGICRQGAYNSYMRCKTNERKELMAALSWERLLPSYKQSVGESYRRSLEEFED